MSELPGPDEVVSALRRSAARAAMASDRRIRSLWRFVLGLLVMLLANFGAGFVASGAGYGRKFEVIYRPLALGLALAGFTFLAKVADERERGIWAYLGLGRTRWMRDSLMGMLLGFLMIMIAVQTIRLFGGLTCNVLISKRTVELVVVELAILATGSMMEEVMFRGYPFQRLIESIGPAAATVVLSCFFGLAHLTNPNASFWGVANTAAIGVLFCVAYLRTHSLWMPFGIHFAWNTTLGLIFGLPVSGLRSFSVVVRSKADGPVWLTGGNYGIEASIVGTIGILVGTAALLILVKQRSSGDPVSCLPIEKLETADGNRVGSIQL